MLMLHNALTQQNRAMYRWLAGRRTGMDGIHGRQKTHGTAQG
jgi:hypothetical protein